MIMMKKNRHRSLYVDLDLWRNMPPPPLNHNEPLQWRHNGRDCISNHQPHHCLLNFRRRSKNPSKLHVTGICAGNSPVTGEFPAQMASNAAMFPFDDVIMLSNIALCPYRIYTCSSCFVLLWLYHQFFAYLCDIFFHRFLSCFIDNLEIVRLLRYRWSTLHRQYKKVRHWRNLTISTDMDDNRFSDGYGYQATAKHGKPA